MWLLLNEVTLYNVLARVFAIIFMAFFILPLHEFAHGWIALKLGDPTAKFYGRLTLNPLESFDVLGAISLLFFGFGWARPVPVDPRNFKNPRRDMALVAFAGPCANIIAAFVSAFFTNLLISINATKMLIVFFTALTTLNISVAAFNFLPLPSLDGFKILEGFLPESAAEKFDRNRSTIVFLSIILMIFGAFNGILFLFEHVLTALVFGITNIF